MGWDSYFFRNRQIWHRHESHSKIMHVEPNSDFTINRPERSQGKQTNDTPVESTLMTEQHIYSTNYTLNFAVGCAASAPCTDNPVMRD